MKGAAKSRGKTERPRSIVKRSAETKLINLPEFVSVTLFIDNLVILSYKTTTKVLLNFKTTYTPAKI